MPPTDDRTTARNDLLNRLQSAFNDWYDREKERLQNESTFLKSVLRGRTGSERVSQSNTSQAEVLVVNDVETFLAGEE